MRPGLDVSRSGRDWPQYADYINRCSICDNGFLGPKRARTCNVCNPEFAKKILEEGEP